MIGLAAPSAQASTVSASLAPVSGTVQPQGVPFSFDLSVANAGGTETTTSVALHIAPMAAPADAVTFDSRQLTVGAGETKVFSLSVVSSQWFASQGMFQLMVSLDDAEQDTLEFEVAPPTVTPVTFENVTNAAGLDVLLVEPELQTCAGSQAQGAAWGDAEGDGDLDLYVPNPNGPSQLWINRGNGRFDDRATALGVDNAGRRGKGAVFVDSDNDGDQDLYVVNIGPNRLYRNDGTGFTDVAPTAGVDDGGRGTAAAWADYDNDGLLDLYVVNYTGCDFSSGPDKLYRQGPVGTFTDVTTLLEGDPDDPKDGMTHGAGFQAAWFDFEMDGDQDLYLANDIIGYDDGNHLWRNNGDGTFTDISKSSGTNLRMGAMGLGVTDLKSDRDFDFGISQMTNTHGNVLFRNNGDETFTDVSAKMGVERPYQRAGVPSVTWGLGFADFNLDGGEDLFFAAGATGMMDFADQPNELFLADGNRFRDLSALSGADHPGYGRAPVFADVNRDGLMDMFLVNQRSPDHDSRSLLYQNTTATAGHWLEVDTVGTLSNRDGCGAVLIARIGAKVRYRQVFCGSIGLSSGNDSVVHFGTGAAQKVDRLTIRWPSGVVQVLTDVSADKLIQVSEPGP